MGVACLVCWEVSSTESTEITEANGMSHSGWGGGIEMAACSHKHQARAGQISSLTESHNPQVPVSRTRALHA